MTRPASRLVARWAPLAALLAVVAATSPAPAGRVNPQAGKAIGGKARADYRPVAKATLARPMRKARGAAPAATALLSIKGVPYLDTAHYENLRDGALDLMRLHSPATSFYVAIGRSPVGIASFLAELDEHMVMTFPASDMRLNKLPEWKASYFEHFRELIPDDVIASERTIVLFDRARPRSGVSLAFLKGYLEEYIATVPGARAKVKAVGLSPKGPLAAGVDLIDTSARPRTFLYAMGKYDHDEAVAPFPNKHRIGQHRLEDLTENPNHAPFRDAMRTRMAHDATLDATLRSEFADLLGDDP
jgi:hypothetical protein